MKLKQIGKGHFSTAYLRPDNKVLLKSRDPIKECMAHGWFPNSYLFPKVEFGELDNEYIMPFYTQVRGLKKVLKPLHFEFYQELRTLAKGWPFEFPTVCSLFKQIKCPRKRQILVEAEEAVRAYAKNERDVGFEISPRNVAVSPSGGLILLDCFFLRSHLKHGV